ncbi:MAG: hypothetical protein AAF813_11515, partial [Pseudomonadota bacterium]
SLRRGGARRQRNSASREVERLNERVLSLEQQLQVANEERSSTTSNITVPTVEGARLRFHIQRDGLGRDRPLDAPPLTQNAANLEEAQ